MYTYGLIGNCAMSALVGADGSIDWLCLPRPDSEPVFGRLLDPHGGHFSIELVGDGTRRTQSYVPNTNILITEIAAGPDAIRITDFCPRFPQFGRMYRPLMLLRAVECLAGAPSIRVSIAPVGGWTKAAVVRERGSSHVRFPMRGSQLRVVTEMPLTYLEEERPFSLTGRTHFGLTWGVGIEDDLARVSAAFFEATATHWQTWVKHCSIPARHQREVIRSALALKLHCFEDTGAILAALTTSLPEHPGGNRNWDYRYCWLRDAYFSLTAFHNLGHFEEMEAFLKFLLNLAQATGAEGTRLAPVYSLSGALPLPEAEHTEWEGYAGSRPVRSNNQAAEHVQNDVYGEMLLTLSPIYFDERFHDLRTREHGALVAHLARSCAEAISGADAGPWEVRDRWQEHSFSNLMCWAGLERASRIHDLGLLARLPFDVQAALSRAEQAIRAAAREGVVHNGPEDATLDASLALLPVLRFPAADLCRATVERIARELAAGGRDAGVESEAGGGFFYRYRRADDFGTPDAAFVVCSFWMVQALASLGLHERARLVMRAALSACNSLGLCAEHFDPAARRQLGNYPQAYSHVGLINAAFAVSPPWHEVL